MTEQSDTELPNQIAAEAAPLEGDVVNEGITPTPYQVERALDIIDDGTEARKVTVIEATAQAVLKQYRIVNFRGKTFILDDGPYPHYRLLGKDEFDKLVYPLAGGVPRSRVGDIYSFTQAVCEDLTPNGHKILFGLDVATSMMHPELTDYDAYFSSNNKQLVWDTRELAVLYSDDPDGCVWRSPFPRVRTEIDNVATNDVDESPLPFIMQLAGGDQGLYDDIMQSIAPIIMDKKPDGVIWWVGSGANGKSTLMDALYRIFPHQFASLNVKRLVDGRDTPTLNGKLANIVKENSEGRIDDTEIYKCLGTHEQFDTHKFHSQESLTINGNIHSIFSGNSIPVFADKGHSIRRRTFIIPFNQVFESDPDFEHKTFTAEFFGKLINEMMRYANRLKEQNYRYKWSAATAGAKKDYDREASNAEEYAAQIIDQGIVAFDSYNPVKMDYENWCADNGYVPLGITNLRKALSGAGFERITTRDGEGYDKKYRLVTIDSKADLQQMGMGRPGMYTTTGFVKPDTDPTVPEFHEPEAPKKTILNGKW